MATSMRFSVKKKNPWKTIEIPEDLLANNEFDSLVEIKELTDYELIPNQTDSQLSADAPNKRKRKKKQAGVLGETCAEDVPPGSKMKQKMVEMDTNVTSPDETLCETASAQNNQIKVKGKKRRKRRKKTGLDSGTEPDKAKTSSLKSTEAVDTSSGLKGDKTLTDEQEASLEASGKQTLDMSEWNNLYVPDVLLKALQDEGFGLPTPIQTMVLPSAIRDKKDILAAAETGSGKTLAFGIPVFARILAWQAESRPEASSQLETSEQELDSGSQQQSTDEEEVLETNLEIEDTMMDSEDLKQESDTPTAEKKESIVENRPPLALILEPTRELAVQVKKHLSALAKHTDIKIATVVGGMSIEKQRRILKKKPHIVIATPGRLWQLIEEGNDHVSQVDRVVCLVVDEADRMVEKGHFEELTKLLEMMNTSARRLKKRQTFVMSATLTLDIEAPRRVKTKLKRKFQSEDKLKSLTEKICIGLKPKVIDLTPKEKVAQTLTELRVNCKADEKDFYLYYFLCQHPGRTLVFANSKDCLRRLVSLLTLLQCSPLPLHADMQQRQRLKNLDKFASNNRGLLVASDVAARGLDIPHVDHVIHYQVPRTMENYVHRSGRTARASNLGLSVMLVGPEDAKEYRKIVHGVRNGEELPLLPVEIELLPAVKQRVLLARDIDVKEYRLKKKRLRNNFFTKAAQEMDMIIDDSNLLQDLGDPEEQAQDRQHLQQLKSTLAQALKSSLAPLRMTKYPTKLGQLMSAKTVNLFQIR